VAHRPRILAIGTDQALADEIQEASATLDQYSPIVEFAEGARRGMELARSRQPEYIFVQATTDLGESSRLLSKLAEVAPQRPVIATFSRSLFVGEVAEETFFIEGMRAGYRDFLRRPIASDELRRLFDAHRRQQQVLVPKRRGTVVAMVSNKGGVGKSSVAVNAAVALAKNYPDDVLLVDASIQMGVCAPMLALEPTTTLTDAARAAERLDSTLLRQLTLVHQTGLHVLASPTDSLESTEISDEFITQVLTLARSTYRYIIVDTFPLFDRLVVAVLDYVDLAYVVLENSVPTVIGCNQFLQLLDQISFRGESRRIVINRYRRSASYPSQREVERRLGYAIDFVLPEDNRLSVSTNTGQPLMQRPPRFSRWAEQCAAIARQIELLDGASDGHPGRRAARESTSDAGNNGNPAPRKQPAADQQRT